MGDRWIESSESVLWLTFSKMLRMKMHSIMTLRLILSLWLTHFSIAHRRGMRVFIGVTCMTFTWTNQTCAIPSEYPVKLQQKPILAFHHWSYHEGSHHIHHIHTYIYLCIYILALFYTQVFCAYIYLCHITDHVKQWKELRKGHNLIFTLIGHKGQEITESYDSLSFSV